MSPNLIPLYYLCSLAGLVMVVGGIWLLFKQKIYIDRESNQVTEIDTPFGKFKTNYPALALFALGFVPLIYPIVQTSGALEEFQIRGNVKASEHPVQVYAVIESDSLMQDRDFSLNVPVLKQQGHQYKVIYVVGSTVLEDTVDTSKRRSGEVHLQGKEIAHRPNTEFVPQINAIPADFQ